VTNNIKKLLELEQLARNNEPKKVLKQADSQKPEDDDQKSTRPQIEDVADKLLEGEKLKNLLDFIKWLRANKISPTWATRNSWMVSVKGKRVCYIRVSQLDGLFTGSWWVSFHAEGLVDENLINDEKLKEIAWSNIRKCRVCNSCFPGNNRVILGKEFEDICGLAAPDFWNPGADEIECMKKLIQAKR